MLHFLVLAIAWTGLIHPGGVIMGAIASQITSLTIAYSTVYSGADQRKYQSSASPAFVRGTHRWPVNSPHKRPVTRKMFPFDDVIMMHSWTDLVIITQYDSFKYSNHEQHILWPQWRRVLCQPLSKTMWVLLSIGPSRTNLYSSEISDKI